MSTAAELAQLELEVLQAARQGVHPEAYEQVYNRWLDANKPHLTVIPELLVDDAAEIESLVVAGNIRDAWQAHYEMTRKSFEQLSPMQRKRFRAECGL